MSNDQTASGYFTITPPLIFSEIHALEEAVAKKTRTCVMSLCLDTQVEHMDEGTFTRITSVAAEVRDTDNAHGVFEFLTELAKLSPLHSIIGDVIVVEEFPTFDGTTKDAVRYTISKGRLLRQFPLISWGETEEVK